jgi:hypothetical protein
MRSTKTVTWPLYLMQAASARQDSGTPCRCDHRTGWGTGTVAVMV